MTFRYSKENVSSLLERDKIFPLIYQFLVKYPVPKNLNYFWNWGFMAGIFFAIQLVSGIFLTFFYIPHIDYAFFKCRSSFKRDSFWMVY